MFLQLNKMCVLYTCTYNTEHKTCMSYLIIYNGDGLQQPSITYHSPLITYNYDTFKHRFGLKKYSLNVI